MKMNLMNLIDLRTDLRNNFENYTNGIYFGKDIETKLLDSVSKEQIGCSLVLLRKIKGTNIVFYHKISYPDFLVDSLLVFLVQKELFRNTNIYSEWGDVFVIIDNRLGSVVLDRVKLYVNMFNERIKEAIHNDDYNHSVYTYQQMLDNLKLMSVFFSPKVFIEFTKLMINKDYSFSGKLQSNPNLYFLPNCLFVVYDLKEFTNYLSNSGFKVNKGPRISRDEVNSMSFILSCIDIDYRKSIQNSFRVSKIKYNLYENSLLKNSDFSYKNIHMRKGHVRNYSTMNSGHYKSDDLIVESNRQKFLEINYTMIGTILNNYYNVDSLTLQKEIEMMLYNQENIFSDSFKDKQVLIFGEKGFNLIEEKKKLLESLLNYTDDDIKKLNTKFHSTKFIPEYKYIISVLGSKKVSLLLLSAFMDLISNQCFKSKEDNYFMGYPSLSFYEKFGKKVFNKLLYKQYKDSSIYKKGGTYTDFFESVNNKYKKIFQDENSYSYIGGNFIGNLFTVELIDEKLDSHPDNPKEKKYYLAPHSKIKDTLIKNNKVLHLPQNLPMICEPKNYGLNKLGGYLLNDENYKESLIKHKKNVLHSTKIRDDNMIIDLVNGFNKTPFKINLDTLDYVMDFGVDKAILIDESDKNFQAFMENPYKKRSKTKKNMEYISKYSKLILQKNILNIAETYSKVDKIYFPVRLCFRTRIYCRTDYFDYQKSDLAKGLISFYNPGYIQKNDEEVIKYFKAFGANMFGNGLDKKSLNFRAKWVDDNSDTILNFKNNNIVNESEYKTCFVSFCFEYIKFIEFMKSIDSVTFATYLPIQLDASCNGYQHLALLTRETELFDKLNLSNSTHDDNPDDFYSYMLDMVKLFIDKQINELVSKDNKKENEIERLNRFIKLKNLNLSRSIIKKITMKESYSASIHTLIKNVIMDENVIEHKELGKKYYTYMDNETRFDWADIVLYIKSLKQTITIIAPKIKYLSDYLDDIAAICTKLNTHIPWPLPNGADVWGSYMKVSEKDIPAFSFTKTRYTFKKHESDKYDLRKQKRALRPNLIHSLDGATIALLYNTLNNINIYTVHDCFAVTADKVPLLINKLKLVYLKMYSSDNYLYKFDRVVREHLSNTIGNKYFKVDDMYISIPINDTIVKRSFPDINKIIKFSTDIHQLKKSSYTII